MQKDPEWSREPVDARLRVTFEAAAEHLEARPDAGRLIFREALGNDVLRTHAAVTLPAFAGTIRSLVVDGNDRRPAVRRQLEATVISGGSRLRATAICTNGTVARATAGPWADQSN